MSKRKRDFDKNIMIALQSFSWPILNNEGKAVYVRKSARNENGFEHIAGKAHLLKVRDILQIPSILKKPYKMSFDEKGKKGKAYYGRRKGKNKSPFLKIVVRIQDNCTEEIVTIYSTKTAK